MASSSVKSKTVSINEWEYSEEIPLSISEIEFLQKKVNEDKKDSKIQVIHKKDNLYELRATSYVGTIKIPNSYVIIIRPKISEIDFVKMLAYSEDLDVIDLFDIVYTSKGEDLVDFMAKYFLDITNEIVQQGIYKSYLSIVDEIPTVKGRLLISQNIRRARPTQEKFWCQYDELSTDVLENQILLYCARLLSVLVKSPKYRSELFDLEHILESQGVSYVNLENHHLEVISIQKLNEHYDKALRLCRFILNLIWYGDFSKEEIPIFGFLYDMDVLFEKFVTRLFSDFLPLKVIPQKGKRAWQYDDGRTAQIRTDILVYDKSGKLHSIIDTKYKKEISEGDRFQIGFYIHEYGKKEGFAILPKHYESKDHSVMSTQQGITIIVRHIDIQKTLSLLYSNKPNTKELLKDDILKLITIPN